MITPFEQPIFVTKPYLPPIESFFHGVSEIWDNSWLTNYGPVLQRYIKQLQRYLQTGNLCVYANGTLALEIGLRALQISGEVITTPFTFVATSHALSWNRNTPVFVDIEPDFYTLDPQKVEAAITPETSAILAVHVFGHPCNLLELERIARKYNLVLIYDAAHAFGVKVDGISIASFGDLSMFSLHATKLYHSIEGGLLAFADKRWENSLQIMKNFGIISETEVVEVGINAKMNEFQALMGSLVLERIDSIIEKRRQITQIYHNRLTEVTGIRLPASLPDNISYNYAYLPVEILDDQAHCSRDDVYESLKLYNVHTRRYFYPLLTDFSCYQNARTDDALPIARRTANRILTLPLYYDLTPDDVHKICDIITAIMSESEYSLNRKLSIVG